eukprot:2378011-Lingulodinium_polyedra.AAC.1
MGGSVGGAAPSTRRRDEGRAAFSHATSAKACAQPAEGPKPIGTARATGKRCPGRAGPGSGGRAKYLAHFLPIAK